MKPPIAYIAGMFPLRSETFVYREVQALRRRGWMVQAISLNPPPSESGMGRRLPHSNHRFGRLFCRGGFQTRPLFCRGGFETRPPVKPRQEGGFETRPYEGNHGPAAGAAGESASSQKEPPLETALESLARDVVTLYGPQTLRTLVGASIECLRHPLRALRTLFTALGDAISPGEGLSPINRIKLIAQSVAAIGLAHRLRPLNIQHIHCHFAHAPTTIGMYAAKQLGIFFSFTGHANDLFQRRSLLKRKLQRAAFVSCISHWHQQLYQTLNAKLLDAKYPNARSFNENSPAAVTSNTEVTAASPQAAKFPTSGTKAITSNTEVTRTLPQAVKFPTSSAKAVTSNTEVTAVSPQIANSMAKTPGPRPLTFDPQSPIPDPRFPIIRCGVDIQQLRPQVRRREGVAAFRILTLCRLVEKKGVDTLIAALAKVRGQGRGDWRLVVAGEGPERERLERQAAELNLSDIIRWLGPVDNDRVGSLLHEADLFVLPCRTDRSGDRDGIPVVLMEAMASGVPVISGDLPAIRELIEDGVSGLLIEGGDVNRLAEHLMRLAGDDAERGRLAAAGRARVEEEFSLDLNISRLEEAMEKVNVW